MTESTASAPDEQEGLAPYRGWGQSDHQNADLKIISSDDRAFWVSSTQLVHYSSVFRAMVSACGSASDTLQLTDAETEDSDHLHTVLETIAAIDKGDSDAISSTLEAYLSIEVVLFAKKYDMKSVISEIKVFLFGLVTQYPPRGGEYCVEAAHLGEWALCGRFIQTLEEWHQDDPRSKMVTRRMLDWRGWMTDDIEILERVSKRFLWAVCRAGTKNARNETDGLGRIDYSGMGQDLANLMMMDDEEAESVVETWVDEYPPWGRL